MHRQASQYIYIYMEQTRNLFTAFKWCMYNVYVNQFPTSYIHYIQLPSLDCRLTFYTMNMKVLVFFFCMYMCVCVIAAGNNGKKPHINSIFLHYFQSILVFGSFLSPSLSISLSLYHFFKLIACNETKFYRFYN